MVVVSGFNFVGELEPPSVFDTASWNQIKRGASLSSVHSGVTFEIDLPQKLVWIESDKDVEVLMQTLQKCGKEVKYNGTK